jgi:transposase
MSKARDCSNCFELQKRVDHLEQRVDFLLDRLDQQEENVKGYRHQNEWLRKQQRQLFDRIDVKQKEIEKRDGQIERLKADNKWLRKQVFGKKAEPKTPVLSPSEPVIELRRSRGKQPGTRGFGRQIREELPVEEVFHFLSPDGASCSSCGLPFTEMSSPEQSEEISWEHKLVRKRHIRQKYVRACCCNGPKIVVAPPAPKLIPKGLFGTDFWVNVLVEKYFLQRPLHKVCQQLGSLGLDVSQGTLTGGLKKLLPLFMPLYQEILKRSQSANRWQMDETHWKVFVDVEEKANHNWWMWVALTDDTCVFVLDPTRSAKVPLKYLEHNQFGILTTDRYSSYQALPDTITHSYCWSHVRRDFINLRDGYPDLAPFAQSWVELIADAFHYNGIRNDCSLTEQERATADIRLRNCGDVIEMLEATKAEKPCRASAQGA